MKQGVTKMSNYTTELRSIIEIGLTPFDFDYARDEESQKIVSNEDLQQGFIDHFYFNEICCETYERWHHFLKTQWKESIREFDKRLKAYAHDIDPLSNFKSTTKGKVVFNDTPKSKLDAVDYASTVTDNDNTVQGFSGVTEIELLDRYVRGLHDIQTEFYESFKNLFMLIL